MNSTLRARTDQDFRDMNEALLVSSLRQHELAQQARDALAALKESENRYRMVVDQVEDYAIFSTDTDGLATTWNKGVERILGFEEQEFLGRDVSAAIFMPEAIAEGIPQQEMDAAARDGKVCAERWMRRKNGDPFFANGVTTALRRGHQLIGFSKVMHDQTEKQRTEVALQMSEQHRRLALDSAELGSWHVDPATNTLSSDERFRTIFGSKDKNLTYEQSFDIIHSEDRERVHAAVAAATRSDHPIRYDHDYRVVHPDTSVHWVNAQGRMNYPGQGPQVIASFDGTVADITERKNHEADRAAISTRLATELAATHRYQQMLADLHRRKDEFLAMLAHELRNPLAPISNAVQLLSLHKNEDARQRQARSIIERQVTQLTRLVDDLMEVSRITTGRLQLRKAPVLLSGIVELAVESSRPFLDQHRHVLDVALPTQPIWLLADSSRLEQVIVNLLSNAAKYTAEGGRVWLSVEQQGDECVLKVRDTGIGISPDFLPHIFDLFTQAERSLDRSQGGLGIGLALVHRLVEMHGGKIEALSSLGHGSEFIVHLPIAAPPATAAPPTAEVQEPAGDSLRVLVVDDSEDTAQTLAMLLEVSGHVVRVGHDGLSAVAEAVAFRPDVILLDIGLPGLDGFEIAKLLRQQPLLHNVVLVAITGYGQEADRRRSEQAGFDHHLVKPAEFNQIRRILATVPRDRG